MTFEEEFPTLSDEGVDIRKQGIDYYCENCIRKTCLDKHDKDCISCTDARNLLM